MPNTASATFLVQWILCYDCQENLRFTVVIRIPFLLGQNVLKSGLNLFIEIET